MNIKNGTKDTNQTSFQRHWQKQHLYMLIAYAYIQILCRGGVYGIKMPFKILHCLKYLFGSDLAWHLWRIKANPNQTVNDRDGKCTKRKKKKFINKNDGKKIDAVLFLDSFVAHKHHSYFHIHIFLFYFHHCHRCGSINNIKIMYFFCFWESFKLSSSDQLLMLTYFATAKWHFAFQIAENGYKYF